MLLCVHLGTLLVRKEGREKKIQVGEEEHKKKKLKYWKKTYKLVLSLLSRVVFLVICAMNFLLGRKMGL